MEERIGGVIKMINLFENFNKSSADFLNSQLIADIKVPSVVIHDDGFLPDEVDSPIKYYCNFSKDGQPLYFDKLPVPRLWRITASARQGEVFDIDKKRAEIHFQDTNNNRFIKEVQWLNDAGQISWVDHYNSKGQKFAKTFYDQGRALLKNFYDQDGKCVIQHHLLTDDIELNYNGTIQYFNGLVDWTKNFLEERKYNLDHIFYNTLNIPFFMDLKLDSPGVDTLFWQENTGESLPGNMTYLMNNQTRTQHIVFQKYNDWQKSQKLLKKSDNVDFRYLGMIYPHNRGNKLRLNALIMTNSDQIENLTKVVTNLSSIHFNIAAMTEMSEKLLSFDKYDNVDLFPGVTPKRVKQLYEDCDIYFDINHQNEILDAVRKAFENNMLIVGFNNTLHNPQYILEENVFDPNDIDKMKNKVLAAVNSVKIMKDQIDKQRKSAGDTSIEDYQKVMGELINEKAK